MKQYTYHEHIPERKFTHPHYTELDKRQLRYMLTRLSQVLETFHWRGNPNALAPVIQELVETDGRHHRIIPIRPTLLRERNAFVIVGFFGQRRFDGDDKGVAARDEMLFDEMEQHAGLLSYSSLEMTNGDYGNCVVFTDETAKNHWGTSQIHQIAADELSPTYYESVRLYNGILLSSIMSPHRLQLTVAKYYDYRSDKLWRGERELKSESVNLAS